MTTSELLLAIQQLMSALRLDRAEKQTWSVLLPVMNEDELKQLHTNLSAQLKKTTDVYLEALANK